MSYLDQVVAGKLEKKIFAILFGAPGTGKTSTACKFPSPLMMDLEGGSSFIDVPRLPQAKTFQEVISQLKEIAEDSRNYETLVIDTLDFLERMANDEVCRENNLKSVAELGFGKGFEMAHQKMVEAFNLAKRINQKMNVVMVAHSEIKRISDPSKEHEYSRTDLKLRDKNASVFKEGADCILYSAMEVHTMETKTGKIKGVGTGNLVMFTSGRPGFEAKNRYSLPHKMPLDYDMFAEAVKAHQVDTAGNLLKSINESVIELKDLELQEKVKAAAKKAEKDPQELARILNKVQAILAS